MKRVKVMAAKCVVIAMAFVLGLASCNLTGLPGPAGDVNGYGDESANENSVSISKDLKLNRISVKFDPCGGIVEPDSKIVKHGSVYGKLPVPRRIGNGFGGWWTEPEGKGTLITSSSKVSAKANHTLYASWNFAPEKIVGTAAVGTTCFFFEFNVNSAKKIARVLVPISSGGYIQNGKMAYKEVIYDLPNLYVDYATGYMMGMTGATDGVSYFFQGMYSPSGGFMGSIARYENGSELNGFLVGTPIFQGTNVVNYVGAATYLFTTPTPQTLLFNATANFDTNEVVGTWCESGEGWPYSIHGTIGGTLNNDNTISLTAAPLPDFEPYLSYPLSVIGEGTFKNPSKKTVSGYLNLYYGDSVLPSTIIAVKDSY
jgi:hypothetical protein